MRNRAEAVSRAEQLVSRMTAEEKAILNAYHRTVYETLAPLLTDDEKAWLKNATRPV